MKKTDVEGNGKYNSSTDTFNGMVRCVYESELDLLEGDYPVGVDEGIKHCYNGSINGQLVTFDMELSNEEDRVYEEERGNAQLVS